MLGSLFCARNTSEAITLQSQSVRHQFPTFAFNSSKKLSTTWISRAGASGLFGLVSPSSNCQFWKENRNECLRRTPSALEAPVVSITRHVLLGSSNLSGVKVRTREPRSQA